MTAPLCISSVASESFRQQKLEKQIVIQMFVPRPNHETVTSGDYLLALYMYIILSHDVSLLKSDLSSRLEFLVDDLLVEIQSTQIYPKQYSHLTKHPTNRLFFC